MANQRHDWDDLDPKLLKAISEGRSFDSWALEHGIPEGTVRTHVRQIRHREDESSVALEQAEAQGLASKQAERGYRQAVNREKSLEQQVVDEIPVAEGDLEDPKIQALLAKGEVNLKLWKPQRCLVNQWGSNLQAKVWLEYVGDRITPEQYREMLREGVQEVLQDLGSFQQVPRDVTLESGYLHEISPFDIHIGKLGWGEEVGESYDSSIAIERAQSAVRDLVCRSMAAYPPERFLWTVGNDLMHADTVEGTTTKGTRMDLDTRFLKMFRAAWQWNAWAILYMAQYAPVDVIVVPGNHDRISAFQVGEVLAALFEENPDVNVDNRASLRKYYGWGINLLGFTHGDSEWHKDLPLIMADEAPELWAKSEVREWHIGHRHNKKQMKWVTADQHRTIGVRILPSLTGQDLYHYQMGYRHIPQAEAWVWHRELANVANFTHFHFPEKTKALGGTA